MREKTIQLIVIVGVLALLILTSVQFFWAQNIVELEDKQFNHKVKIALSNAGYKLRLIQHSSISTIHPVKQVSENQFIVEIQDIINPIAIDSILQQEFQDLELELPYNIAIYDCFTDSVVHSLGGSKQQKTVAAEEFGVNWNLDSYNFGVIFPTENRYRQDLNIWAITILVILMMAVLLGYVIYLLVQQKKLDDIKNDFINNMTHELKTPISTISLSADVLCNEENYNHPERISRYAHIIREENARLKSQVEKVLQAAFLEHEKINLAFSSVDLKEIIEKAAKPFALKLENLSGSIEITGPAAVIQGDPQHLTHLFSNLIDNAIKYAIDAPEIKISIQEQERYVTVAVCDNGIGISADNQKNIFKKFYRVPTGNIHNVKGFGIGLNYVKLIAEEHKGTVEVSDNLEKGTCFTLNFPKESHK